jgi:hypothetical protein
MVDNINMLKMEDDLNIFHFFIMEDDHIFLLFKKKLMLPETLKIVEFIFPHHYISLSHSKHVSTQPDLNFHIQHLFPLQQSKIIQLYFSLVPNLYLLFISKFKMYKTYE